MPLETPLLAAARARGLKTADGLGMLLHQAVRGFELWFGQRPGGDGRNFARWSRPISQRHDRIRDYAPESCEAGFNGYVSGTSCRRSAHVRPSCQLSFARSLPLAMVAASTLYAIAQQPPSPTRVRGTIEGVNGDVLAVKSRGGEDVKLHMTG